MAGIVLLLLSIAVSEDIQHCNTAFMKLLILGYISCSIRDSRLLEIGALSIGKQFLTFQRGLIPFCSGSVQAPLRLHRLRRSSYLGKLKSSSHLLPEPQISLFCCCVHALSWQIFSS